MTGLTKLSLKRPVSVCIVLLALLIFGSSAVFSTPMELIPDIEMPMLFVMTVYPGAAPQDVENQVSKTIENAASTLNGVKNIQSMSLENASVVILELEYGTDMNNASVDLKSNIDMYKSSLPDDAQSPIVLEMSSSMMPVITLSATPIGDVDLKYYVEEEIQPELEKLSGVASISVSGGSTDYIKVQIKEEKLAQYNLSTATLSSLLAAADFSLPAGSIGQGNLDLILRGGVSYSTPEELKMLPITMPTGDIIHLGEVADIYMASTTRDSLSRYNGLENVSISISKRQSASTIATAAAVRKVVNEVNSSNLGVKLEVINDTSDQIISSVTAVVQTLILGVILAMLVLFLFLGSWRASIIVGSSIPASLLVTLIALSVMGFSFNILSLGGLVIGVGMMVDNSIVVIESCFRAKTKQASFKDAAMEGVGAVASSIVASTITTVVVFLPIALLKGMSGQLFGQLCFTIVFSLVASLLSALTIVPLTFYKLKPVEKEESVMAKFMDRVSSSYAKFLPKTFAHKWLVVLVAIVLLIASFGMIPLIGMELIPATDDGIIAISVSARPGLSVDSLDSLMRELEDMVSVHPDVERYSLSSGGSGMTALMGGNSAATLTAYLRSNREMSTNEIVDQWRIAAGNTIDYEISVSASSSTVSMTGGIDAEIVLLSTDYDALKATAADVEAKMRGFDFVLRTSSSLSSGNPQAEIIVDPVKAAAKGLVPKQIMGTIYGIMNGTEATKLTNNGREYSVKIEYPEDRFKTVSDLSSLYIANAGGMQVPLLDVAEIVYSDSPQSITRKNGSYYLTITGQLASHAPNDAKTQITNAVKELEFPRGVSLDKGSQEAQMMEEFSSLLGAILTAVLLVFMVMAIQFESPVFSGVVMLSIPFALIGSFAGLLVFNSSISMPSLMGLLMLVGIVVNNAILLIDTTGVLRAERNLSPEDALLTAGMLRMRPIFMTALTTILAMLPMSIGIGGSADLMRGMAIIIIGGLIASTVLTLLLLPTFYLLTDKQVRKEKKAKKKALKEAKKQAKQG